EGRLERGDGELVDAQRSVPRILLEPRDTRAPADDDAGLRPAEELVARERHEVHARGHRFLDGRLVRKAPRPQVEERTGAEALHPGKAPLGPELDELARRPRGGEADDAVVGRVDLEQERGVGGDRVGVVAQVSPVRRAYPAEPRATAEHDVGDPELTADLDQLAARDDDLATVPQRLHP